MLSLLFQGLLESLKVILPHVEHRQCARHIYANFRKRHTCLELKNLFRAAASSSHEGDFMANMEEIKKITTNGYDWLMAKNPPSWCRSFLYKGMHVRLWRIAFLRPSTP